MEKRLKKTAITVAVIAVVLMLGAVVLGVLNALVGNGEWNLGWNDYRYDESGYEIGEGTVASDAVTSIDLDWIDGEVEIISCDDRYISISEHADEPLPESAEVRWRVDEDGTLRIKYRKSSWFFAVGSGNRQKKLTLRIPKGFFDRLNEINVAVESTDVVMYDVFAASLFFSSSSGSLGVKNCVFASLLAETASGNIITEGVASNEMTLKTKSGAVDMRMDLAPNRLGIATVSGDVTLRLLPELSVTTKWTTESGRVSFDLPLTETDGKYILGGGVNSFEIETVSGDLTLLTKK